MAVRGLGGDPERARDLLGLQAAREQSDDLGLALGQPRGPRNLRRPMPGRVQYCGDAVAVQPAGVGLLAEQVGRLLAACSASRCGRGSVIAW